VAVLVCAEVIVGPALDDVALVHDTQDVAVADRAQPMSDDDRGPAFHGSIESLLHDLLAGQVKSRSRLVKDQNAWVLDQSTSDGDSLLLAT